MIVSIYAIILLAMVFVFGYYMGMGKVLQVYKSGIFGIAINICLAIMFGGLIRGIPQVQDLLNNIQVELGNRFEILRNIPLETIIFYVLFFLALTIIKIFLINFFKIHDNSKVFVLRFVSRLCGAFANVLFFVGLALIFFALLHYFKDTIVYDTIVQGIKESWVEWLFVNNPIIL
ncbi:MAG: hypothetical protein FWF56_04570 [Firmicutes bacterium]|nr:hypothetical protein [Bacillota bacterium]